MAWKKSHSESMIKAGDEIKDASQTIFETESGQSAIEVPAETTRESNIGLYLKKDSRAAVAMQLQLRRRQRKLRITGVSAITETPSAPVAKPLPRRMSHLKGFYAAHQKGKICSGIA
ncbi:hypothetical protein CHS0354_002098 [Potamilus streckersoni]|uniref:Uncharacterized protein n=1 Tax=Potamilus streckersoni TaxID=2493646 RepID=A0AAE0W8M6_9BIVA|nr:hypothetical protein CHS0354_002098 [Potamilus streckersoni]